MTATPTTSDDLEVLQQAASHAGLDAADACLLRNGTNAVFLLPHANVVARLGRSGTADNAARQVEIASWLSANGINANLPIEGLDLVTVGGRPVTWWTPIPSHRHATPAELGTVLRKIHDLPVPSTIDLPNLDIVEHVAERIGSAQALPASDRDWLQGRLAKLDADLAATVVIEARNVVHGDAWQGNLVVPDDGSPILLDFDHVSIGHPARNLIPLAVDHEDFARIDAEDYKRLHHRLRRPRCTRSFVVPSARRPAGTALDRVRRRQGSTQRRRGSRGLPPPCRPARRGPSTPGDGPPSEPGRYQPSSAPTST